MVAQSVAMNDVKMDGRFLGRKHREAIRGKVPVNGDGTPNLPSLPHRNAWSIRKRAVFVPGLKAHLCCPRFISGAHPDQGHYERRHKKPG